MPGALRQTVLPILASRRMRMRGPGSDVSGRCHQPSREKDAPPVMAPALRRCRAWCSRGAGRIGPVQPGALVRLQVGWLALPQDGGEEEADARLTIGAAVVNDVTEGVLAADLEEPDRHGLVQFSFRAGGVLQGDGQRPFEARACANRTRSRFRSALRSMRRASSWLMSLFPIVTGSPRAAAWLP